MLPIAATCLCYRYGRNCGQMAFELWPTLPVIINGILRLIPSALRQTFCVILAFKGLDPWKIMESTGSLGILFPEPT